MWLTVWLPYAYRALTAISKLMSPWRASMRSAIWEASPSRWRMYLHIGRVEEKRVGRDESGWYGVVCGVGQPPAPCSCSAACLCSAVGSCSAVFSYSAACPRSAGCSCSVYALLMLMLCRVDLDLVRLARGKSDECDSPDALAGAPPTLAGSRPHKCACTCPQQLPHEISPPQESIPPSCHTEQGRAQWGPHVRNQHSRIQ